MRGLRIVALPGYSPTVGRLVCMLNHVREDTLAVLDGLSREELDTLHDPASNTIGALLAHVGAVERWYQIVTFGGRAPSEGEDPAWSAALQLGEEARRTIRGRDLQAYVDELAGVRRTTLAALAARDDAWLEAPLAARPEINAHWAWFHVAEDEISHRGQIRWLRKRLPGRGENGAS